MIQHSKSFDSLCSYFVALSHPFVTIALQVQCLANGEIAKCAPKGNLCGGAFGRPKTPYKDAVVEITEVVGGNVEEEVCNLNPVNPNP